MRQLQYGQIQIFESPDLENKVAERKYAPVLERISGNNMSYHTFTDPEKRAIIRMGMTEVPEWHAFAYFFDSNVEGIYPKSRIYIAQSHVVPCIKEASETAARMNFAGVKKWKIKNGLWIPNQEFVVLGSLPKSGPEIFNRVLEHLVLR